MNDCIFCKIINGQLPSYKIYEDDFAYAYLDISGDYFGHTLVVPKKHFVNVLDCDAKFLQGVINAVQIVSNHFVRDCGFDGVNVLNASGQSAEQSVFHLHFHVIPRKQDDGLHLYPARDNQGYDLAQVCAQLVVK